jgi:hypothetical protein
LSALDCATEEIAIRRLKSLLRNYLHLLKAAERSGALRQAAGCGPEADTNAARRPRDRSNAL